MAGERVERSHLISDEALRAFADLSKDVEKTIKTVDKLIDTMRAGQGTIAMADTIKKINDETNKLTGSQKKLEEVQKTITDQVKKRAAEEQKSIDQMIEARRRLEKNIKDLRIQQKEDIELMKRQIITRAELNKRLNESSQAIVVTQQRLKALTKETNNEIIAAKGLGGEYLRLTAALANAEVKYRNLLASGKATKEELAKQEEIFKRLNTQVTAVDTALGRFHKNVGNYPAIVGAAGRTLVSFLQAFGLVGGVYLFAKAIKDVIGLSIDFESANSRLAGVLGLTKNEIVGLREQQLELAAVTLYNAESYAKLQIELAKLGFPIKDIERMTESTAKASIAMGSDLAAQAELTGSVLHQYGLEANQVERVNDALSKSTTASALDFSKLATALPYVGSAAHALGFSLEETLALMGQLSNTGLAASTVGTSLRKIFLLLADSSSNLSKKFKEPVRDLPTLIKGLKELNLNQTQLGEALKLTDIRSVVAFQSLIDGADKVERLNKVIEDSTGFTNELAHTVKDNLGGDVKLAGAAIDSLAISMGEELEPAMRLVVQGFTSLLRALKQAPEFLRENKDLILALVLALLAFNIKQVVTIANNIAMSVSFSALRVSLLAALSSFRLFIVAMATNPFAVLLLSMAAVITGFNIFEKTLGKTGQLIKLRTEANDKLTKSYDDLSQALSDLTVNEAEYARLTEKEKANRISLIKLKVAEAEATIMEGEATLALLKVRAEELSFGQQNRVLKLQEMGKYAEAADLVKRYRVENMESNEEYRESVKVTSANITKLNELRQSLNKTIKTYDELEEALKTAREKELGEEEFKLLAEKKKAYLDLMQFRKELEVKALQEIAENENESLADRLTALRQIEGLRTEIVEIERKKALIVMKKGEEQSAEEIKLITEKSEAAKTEIVKKGQQDRTEVVKKTIEDRLKLEEEALKKFVEKSIENLQFTIAYEKALVEQKYIDGLISREKADKEIQKLAKQNAVRLIQGQIDLLATQLQGQNKFETERLLLVAGSEKEEMAIRKSSAAERELIEKKIAELKLKLTEATFENTAGTWDKEIEILQNVLTIYQAWAYNINALFNAITDRKLSNLEKEIRAVTAWEEEQLRLAGDNDAEKERIERNAEARREQLEKKKLDEQRKAARREKAVAIFEAGIRTSLAVLNALSTVKPFIPNGVAAGVLAGVLGAVQIATIAAKPIPQFYKGGTTKDAIVMAGERGTEMYKTPSGDIGLTPSKATLMNLPIGTEIYPHEETTRKLAMGAFDRVDSVSMDYVLGNKMDSMVKEIKQVGAKTIKAIAKNKPGNLYREMSIIKEAQDLENGDRQILRRSYLGRFKD